MSDPRHPARVLDATLAAGSFMLFACGDVVDQVGEPTTAAQPAFFGVHVQKGEVKLIAYTSIPCSNISFAAMVLSNPPDRSPTALIFVFFVEECIFLKVAAKMYLLYY